MCVCYYFGRCTRGVRESFVRNVGGRAAVVSTRSRRTICHCRRLVFTHLPGSSGGQYEPNGVRIALRTYPLQSPQTIVTAPRLLPRIITADSGYAKYLRRVPHRSNIRFSRYFPISNFSDIIVRIGHPGDIANASTLEVNRFL